MYGGRYVESRLVQNIPNQSRSNCHKTKVLGQNKDYVSHTYNKDYLKKITNKLLFLQKNYSFRKL